MEEKDFSIQVFDIAKELQNLVDKFNKNGKSCSVIIMSSEKIDDMMSKNNIGVFGNGKQAANVLHDFATQSSTRSMFMEIAKYVAFENIIKS